VLHSWMGGATQVLGDVTLLLLSTALVSQHTAKAAAVDGRVNL
jgi:hypothetical protein